MRDVGTPVDRLSRTDRRALLARMDAVGIFSRRHSVPVVARALRVSRSAIYQLLAEVRKEPHVDADAS